MTQAQVIAQIQQFIITNGNQEITANVLRPILEAICNQANDKIGTLTSLATSEQGSVVGSINELYQLIEDNTGVVIHQGSDNPNTTPPETFSVTDYYIQEDNGVTTLWQYNSNEWIKIQKQSTPVKFRYFSNNWNNGNSSTSSLVAYLNSLTLSIENELTYFYSLKPVGSQSQGQQAEAHFWIFNKGSGVYGQNATPLTASDFRYMGPVSYSDSETVWNLGEIGTNTIESIVNQSGPFDVVVGGVNLFKALRDGVAYNYFYVGQETPIGLGEYQTNNDEYVEVAPGDNFPPDLSDYVTYEDFQKAFYDLNDFILTDLIENVSFGDANFYLIEADNEVIPYHFAIKNELSERFTNFGIKFANTNDVRHDLTNADYIQDGYHIWKLPNISTYNDLQNNLFQVWFYEGDLTAIEDKLDELEADKQDKSPVDGKRYSLIDGGLVEIYKEIQTTINDQGEIDVSNPMGTWYNEEDLNNPCTLINFTITNIKAGGYAFILVQANTNNNVDSITINGNNDPENPEVWVDNALILLRVKAITDTIYRWKFLKY